jgi:hypothetical protein
VQQSHQPFSKKSFFNNGVSCFFKSTAAKPDAMARSTMSGGGLEAQKTPDLLWQLMFAIGTQGKVIPNVSIEHPNPAYETEDKYNPTEVILNAITATIEATWAVRLKTVPHTLDELKKLQIIMNTSHARVQQLFNMKQWLCESDKCMSSGKGRPLHKHHE